MNFKNLQQDIFYAVKEEQIKLGYRKETIRLYYPEKSLCRLLEKDMNTRQLGEALDEFNLSIENEIGTLSHFRSGERFCLCISPELTQYVHENTENHGFLYELIDAVAGHLGIDAIKAVFEKYSDKVHFEAIDTEEFDYLIYFEDKKPDESYFCFKAEGHHITYHRFAKVEYEAMMSE